jgi:hypothetical protein
VHELGVALEEPVEALCVSAIRVVAVEHVDEDEQQVVDEIARRAARAEALDDLGVDCIWRQQSARRRPATEEEVAGRRCRKGAREAGSYADVATP